MAAPTTVVWYRRDLRVADHPPLAEAAERGRLACLFVRDPELLGRRHHAAPARLRLGLVDEALRPAGRLRGRFVPELRDVPDGLVHEPWRMSPEEQRAAGCRLGRDYPEPRVDHRERRGVTLERYRAASP